MESNFPVDPSVKTQDIYPNPDKETHTDLIAFVHDRCKENDGLIAKIAERKAVAGATIVRKQLRARCLVAEQSFRFPVRENTETVGMNTFVAEWCPTDTTYIDTEAECPFPINWHLDAYDKFVQTNKDARRMATMLAIAEGSSKSKHVLVKLLRNVTKMADQLRQLSVLTGNASTAGVGIDATVDVATRRQQLQDDLESAVQSVLRKHGAVAEETDTGMSATSSITPATVISASAIATGVSTVTDHSSAVQAAMSAMNVLAEHRASLLQWISEAHGAPYTGNTLTLQYQASRDGYQPDDFRRMCNGQGSMVFIVRSDKGYLFGGYTSVGFTQYTITEDTDYDWAYARDDAAFLFTLTNPHGVAPSKYRCKRPERALINCCCGDDDGMYFSNGFVLKSDCNTIAGSGVGLDSDKYDTPHGVKTFTGSRDGWTVTEVLGFRV